jgi:hypothetical protein
MIYTCPEKKARKAKGAQRQIVPLTRLKGQ